MNTATHEIALTKYAKRSLNPGVIDERLTELLKSINTQQLNRSGWTVTAPDSEQVWTRDGDAINGYTYRIALTIAFAHESKMPLDHELPALLRKLYKRASQPLYGSWVLSEVEGQTFEVSSDGEAHIDGETQLGYVDVEIPEDFETEFAHLYGLSSHVARIRAAVEAAIMSGFANRYHCALIGPPGCGKSDMCQSLKRALGEHAVMEYDATATTAAGAIEEIGKRDVLPRVLIVEEIEKADPKSLAYLLALCDLRGEVRKTTARGKIERDAKMLVIATVNDFELFSTLQAGALASRFANKIWYKRPTREMLEKIVMREIERINGDEEWCAPALDYCDEKEISDPRMAVALTLCGRDMLITGEYQQMLAETSPDSGDGKAMEKK